ncbi:hypothetical protein C0J52_02602 [Blattella germanica]|nr:hypothetical protein C0J52_02602 [Blattella germanica]
MAALQEKRSSQRVLRVVDPDFEANLENLISEVLDDYDGDDSYNDEDYEIESDISTDSEQEADEYGVDYGIGEEEADLEQTECGGYFYGKDKCLKWRMEQPPINSLFQINMELEYLTGPERVEYVRNILLSLTERTALVVLQRVEDEFPNLWNGLNNRLIVDGQEGAVSNGLPVKEEKKPLVNLLQEAEVKEEDSENINACSGLIDEDQIKLQPSNTNVSTAAEETLPKTPPLKLVVAVATKIFGCFNPGSRPESLVTIIRDTGRHFESIHQGEDVHDPRTCISDQFRRLFSVNITIHCSPKGNNLDFNIPHLPNVLLLLAKERFAQPIKL